MDSNEEYEEEEETLVMAELQGIMESDYLSQIKQAKVLGIATDKPLLQLDDYTFAGQYQNAMGTYMFFEELPNEDPDDREDEDEDAEEGRLGKLEYRLSTNKKLGLERVFLNKTPDTASKEESENQSASSSLFSESGAELHSESGVKVHSESGAELHSESGVELHSESVAELHSESGAELHSESGAEVQNQQKLTQLEDEKT